MAIASRARFGLSSIAAEEGDTMPPGRFQLAHWYGAMRGGIAVATIYLRPGEGMSSSNWRILVLAGEQL